MQKIEIILAGEKEKECARLINDLAHVTMKHYEVTPLDIYCGAAPIKRGIGELKVPGFLMNRKQGEG